MSTNNIHPLTWREKAALAIIAAYFAAILVIAMDLLVWRPL